MAWSDARLAKWLLGAAVALLLVICAVQVVYLASIQAESTAALRQRGETRRSGVSEAERERFRSEDTAGNDGERLNGQDGGRKKPSSSSGGKWSYKRGLPIDEKRRAAVVEEMRFSWNAYKKHAWGEDVLRPIAKSSKYWVGAGVTIVDALDTLYIMGLKEEYAEGLKWVKEELQFTASPFITQIPLFETTIRVLGGLLGAYSLTNEPALVEKARELGDQLMYAFEGSPTGYPHPTADRIGKRGSGPVIVTAEIGTLQLEFAYLSVVTGEPRYADAALRVFANMNKLNRGMVPSRVSVGSGTFSGELSIGANSDSYYEYLLKMWIFSDKTEPMLRTMYERVMDDIHNKLTFRSTPSNLVYIAQSWDGFSGFRHSFGHLGCFCGGMFALGAEGSPTRPEKDMTLGKEIAKTCHEMYARSPTGIAGEDCLFLPNDSSKDFRFAASYYILRPEVIETWFYLYRFTGDEKYRDWAWDAFQSIQKYCKYEGGYTGIGNVNAQSKAGTRPDDHMRTFWLGETLKYLYLIFSDETVIPLDDYVFNTEAHPFPVQRGGSKRLFQALRQ